MRPLLAILLTVGLLGGVWSYTEFAERVRRPPAEIKIDYAEGKFSIEIDRSFDCAGDPILETESLKVLFKGEKVFAKSEPIAKSVSIVIENLDNVEAGANEIFVSANMLQASEGLGAMRIVVKRNDVPIAEKLLTSAAGLTEVSGPVTFTIVDETHDDHTH